MLLKFDTVKYLDILNHINLFMFRIKKLHLISGI